MHKSLSLDADGCCLTLDVNNEKFDDFFWCECYIKCNGKKYYFGEDSFQNVLDKFMQALKRTEDEFVDYCKNTREPAIGVIAFGGVWNYLEARYVDKEIIFYWRTKNKNLLGETKLTVGDKQKWLQMLEDLKCTKWA